MNVYLIRKRNPKTGRKRLTAYRLIIKTNGLPEFVIQLAANKYTSNDVQQLAGILGAIVDACNAGNKIDHLLFDALDRFPDVKRRLIKKDFLTAVKEKTLVDIWNEYERANVDGLKAGTFQNKRNSINKFFQCIDPETPADEFNKRHAQHFRQWLNQRITRGEISEATAAGYIRDVKRVFNWAKESDLLALNQLDDVKRGSFVNRERDHYITPEELNRILDACATQPDAQAWKVLFLLYRVQGLRKEEPRLLKWKDVDLDAGVIVITSPKTERYKGKGTRTAPLFPDVAEALKKLRDEQRQRGELSTFVLSAIPANHRQTAEKILARAGVEQWGKLFQNLRASAATDIDRHFGAFRESQWVGHSADVAAKHYLQITADDISAARSWSPLK